jgi:inosine/xanthosine triphosphatase
MKICVGSQNKIKIKAVKETLKLYPQLFPNPEIKGIDVKMPLFDHPKDLKATVQGAIARAKKAFISCAYSFGLEGGLMTVPFTNTGFMEASVCALYNGKKIYLGLGPAFAWPKKVNDLILQGKADASQAFKKLGLTNHQKLGEVSGGGIGLLTDYKVTREDLTRYSIMMALVELENPNIYKTVKKSFKSV